jgi:hypothetical protein
MQMQVAFWLVSLATVPIPIPIKVHSQPWSPLAIVNKPWAPIKITVFIFYCLQVLESNV